MAPSATAASTAWLHHVAAYLLPAGDQRSTVDHLVRIMLLKSQIRPCARCGAGKKHVAKIQHDSCHTTKTRGPVPMRLYAAQHDATVAGCSRYTSR
jgi:hypothetical protein